MKDLSDEIFKVTIADYGRLLFCTQCPTQTQSICASCFADSTEREKCRNKLRNHSFYNLQWKEKMGKEAEQMETSSMAFRNVVQKFHCALIISSIYFFWGGEGGGRNLLKWFLVKGGVCLRCIFRRYVALPFGQLPKSHRVPDSFLRESLFRRAFERPKLRREFGRAPEAISEALHSVPPPVSLSLE